MQDGFAVSKVAILAAPPSDEEKEKVIAAALDTLVCELDKAGIAHHALVSVPPREIRVDKDTDLFLVLGGDGTMLHFAGELSKTGLPFFGLNYGNVGFMMNNPERGLANHVARLRLGQFHIWEFPLLGVRARDLNGGIHTGHGLNDIYLQRMTAQSVRVNVILGDQHLGINPVLCDGVIVATPLGSTAYNYNTTGSLVAIDTPALTLTPIAAYRSCPVSCMMLPLDTRIRFEILEPRKRRVQMVSDGQAHGDLTSAEVQVTDARVKLCFDAESSLNLPLRFINKALRGK